MVKHTQAIRRLLPTNCLSVFEHFVKLALKGLNKHAPCKKKQARRNQMPFFNKELSKTIMTRTKLQNIFLQNTGVRKIEYVLQKKQIFVSLF